MSRAPLEKKGDEFHQAILEECQQSNGEERRNGRDGLKMDFVLSDDVKEANDGKMETSSDLSLRGWLRLVRRKY